MSSYGSHFIKVITLLIIETNTSLINVGALFVICINIVNYIPVPHYMVHTDYTPYSVWVKFHDCFEIP
jgi:hypothetical protein